MNITNSYSAAFYKEQGLTDITLSFELNLNQAKANSSRNSNWVDCIRKFTADDYQKLPDWKASGLPELFLDMGH